MTPDRPIAVRLKSGLVIWHSKAELEAMWKNVDPLAAKVLDSGDHGCDVNPVTPEEWQGRGVA
jgi:hypothetical protein